MHAVKNSGKYDVASITISNELDQLPTEISKDEHKCTIPKRHLVAAFAFLACIMISYHRAVIGVSIVAMAIHTDYNNGLNQSTSCPTSFNTNNTSRKIINGEFDWNSSLQGYVLSSFYLGYLFLQILAGRIAEIWGTKRTFLLGNTLSAALLFLIPFAAWYNVYALITIQFIRGLAHGFLLPPVYVIMAKWFPRNERGLLSTLSMCGFSVGSVFGGSLSGWLCDIPQFRWPSSFYACSLFTLLLSIIFAVLFYESPDVHPYISKSELQYIKDGQETDSNIKIPPLPLKAMLTSVPLYALAAGLIGQYWSVIYFVTVNPTYMATILHFGMTADGVLSSIPMLGKTFGGILASVTSNWLLKHDYVGINNLRKGCNTIGSFGFCACILGVYFSGCNSTSNIIFFTLSLFASGISLSGSMIACVDMSPTFAGTLLGILSTVASLSHVILPIIAGQLTKNQTIEEWHQVFFISIGVVFLAGVIFHVFGSVEVQPWNYAEDDERNTKKY